MDCENCGSKNISTSVKLPNDTFGCGYCSSIAMKRKLNTLDGIQLEERKSNAFMKVVLCKEDKEQLNRIEEMLERDDGFKDSGFPGCQFRLSCKDYKLAVNVTATGERKYNGFNQQARCKIEFIGDGEPSSFCGGIIYYNAPR